MQLPRLLVMAALLCTAALSQAQTRINFEIRNEYDTVVGNGFLRVQTQGVQYHTTGKYRDVDEIALAKQGYWYIEHTSKLVASMAWQELVESSKKYWQPLCPGQSYSDCVEKLGAMSDEPVLLVAENPDLGLVLGEVRGAQGFEGEFEDEAIEFYTVPASNIGLANDQWPQLGKQLARHQWMSFMQNRVAILLAELAKQGKGFPKMVRFADGEVLYFTHIEHLDDVAFKLDYPSDYQRVDYSKAVGAMAEAAERW